MPTNRGGFWELVPLAEWELGNNGAGCVTLLAVASNRKFVNSNDGLILHSVYYIKGKFGISFH